MPAAAPNQIPRILRPISAPARILRSPKKQLPLFSQFANLLSLREALKQTRAQNRQIPQPQIFVQTFTELQRHTLAILKPQQFEQLKRV